MMKSSYYVWKKNLSINDVWIELKKLIDEDLKVGDFTENKKFEENKSFYVGFR